MSGESAKSLSQDVPTPTGALDRQDMKILVVDDEEEIRKLCRKWLDKAGYRISTVPSGDEAATRLDEGWDIILTDITMPGAVDGIQLLQKARREGNTDVIIMTAFPEFSTVVHALRQGAYDYITKPFAGDTLLRTLERCVEKRRLSVELLREKALRSELQNAYDELKRMKRENETFGHFLAPEVARFVIDHPQEFWKQGERKVATLLFADVRRFTPFAVSMTPEVVLEALNQILACIIEAVTSEGGTLNKFMGDGILALFGAPVANDQHYMAAARAALKAQKAVAALAEVRKSRGEEALRIGIGMNTGVVVAGYLGTEHRAEYSVIGHAVNLAARLEKIAAPGQILIGLDTHRLLNGAFQMKELPPVIVPGIVDPVTIAELLG